MACLSSKDYFYQIVYKFVFQSLAEESNGSLKVEFRKEFIASLEEHRHQKGPFDDIIVSTGAAIGSIKELTNLLPLRLCQVHYIHSTLVMLHTI